MKSNYQKAIEIVNIINANYGLKLLTVDASAMTDEITQLLNASANSVLSFLNKFHFDEQANSYEMMSDDFLEFKTSISNNVTHNIKP